MMIFLISSALLTNKSLTAMFTSFSTLYIAKGISASNIFPIGSRHSDSRGTTKRSTSSERRPMTPTHSQTHKRKRRSSGSPAPPSRKRRSSPSSSKGKPSYTAATSRSGSLGKSGGDRDLRESHGRSRNWKQRSSLSPRPRGGKKNKGHKKAQLTGANAVSIEPLEGHSRSRSGNTRRPSSPAERGLRRNRSRYAYFPRDGQS